MLVSAAMLVAGSAPLQAFAANSSEEKAVVNAVVQINPTTVEVRLNDGGKVTLDFYGENIFRMFRDINGGVMRDPVATPEAKILVGNPRKNVGALNVKENEKSYTISTEKVEITICKKSGAIKTKNLVTGEIAFEETEPVIFKNAKTTITLSSR